MLNVVLLYNLILYDYAVFIIYLLPDYNIMSCTTNLFF